VQRAAVVSVQHRTDHHEAWKGEEEKEKGNVGGEETHPLFPQLPLPLFLVYPLTQLPPDKPLSLLLPPPWPKSNKEPTNPGDGRTNCNERSGY